MQQIIESDGFKLQCNRSCLSKLWVPVISMTKETKSNKISLNYRTSVTSLSLWSLKNNLMMFWVLVSANPYSDSFSPLWTLGHCQVFSSLHQSPDLPTVFIKNFSFILSLPPHPECIQSPRSYWYDIVILTKESGDYLQNCTQKVYLTFHLWCSGSSSL